MPRINRLTRLSRRSALLLILVLIVVAGLVWATSRHKGDPVIPSSNPLTTEESSKFASPSAGSSQPATADNTSSASTNPSSSTGPAPIAPYGNFVSNHNPGGNNPTTEASTCNTSIGATCYIRFTNGSTVKKLDPETANANGGAIWYWDVNSAGLSAGTWMITAVATLNGQTKTTNDAMDLVVQ